MWRWSRPFNPLVRAILRSPLHGLLDRWLILLRIQGRRSGAQLEFPVLYAQDGKTLVVLVGWHREKQWWRNLETGAPVRVVLRGVTLDGRAEVIAPGSDATEACIRDYMRRIRGVAKELHVRLGPDGEPNAQDLRAAAERTLLVRVALGESQ